jgi:hypothetical protein
MVDKLILALEGQKWEEARWLAQAILHLKGVSKAQSSKHSTKSQVPLCAVDLRTLLDTLLETPTSTDLSGESMWRSKLKSLVKSLPSSSSAGSTSGQKGTAPVAGSQPSYKPLPSKRQYWPGEAKDVFWDMIRELNTYDKEQGNDKSPIQLLVAEEITRRWWEVEYEGSSDPD